MHIRRFRPLVLALCLVTACAFSLGQEPPAAFATQAEGPAERHPFYLSLGGFMTGPGLSPVVRIGMGHDALLGNPSLLGARVTFDKSFGPAAQPLSIAVDGTWRFSSGNVDAYAGVGGGLQFSDPLLPFGEMVIGADLRLESRFAPYLEGRYRFYVPDGQGTQAGAGSVLIGVQFRRSTE